MANIVPHDKLQQFQSAMAKIMPSMKAVATKHMTPERLAKLAAVSAGRNPLLVQCFEDSPQTVLRCFLTASQLGLEPDSPLGLCYLVPFKNKFEKYEAQFIIGYRGLISLARRSGEIISIESRVVHEKDAFDCVYGLEAKLEHKPSMDADPGKLVAAYAIAKLRDGGVQYEIMFKSEIEKIRARSKAGNSKYSPWATDYEEMARKTVVRRLCKYLPISVETAQAMEAEKVQEEGGFSEIDIDTGYAELPEAQAQEPSKGDEILNIMP